MRQFVLVHSSLCVCDAVWLTLYEWRCLSDPVWLTLSDWRWLTDADNIARVTFNSNNSNVGGAITNLQLNNIYKTGNEIE